MKIKVKDITFPVIITDLDDDRKNRVMNALEVKWNSGDNAEDNILSGNNICICIHRDATVVWGDTDVFLPDYEYLHISYDDIIFEDEPSSRFSPKIGDTLTLDGVTVKVVKGQGCDECYFNNHTRRCTDTKCAGIIFEEVKMKKPLFANETEAREFIEDIRCTKRACELQCTDCLIKFFIKNGYLEAPKSIIDQADDLYKEYVTKDCPAALSRNVITLQQQAIAELKKTT